MLIEAQLLQVVRNVTFGNLAGSLAMIKGQQQNNQAFDDDGITIGKDAHHRIFVGSIGIHPHRTHAALDDVVLRLKFARHRRQLATKVDDEVVAFIPLLEIIESFKQFFGRGREIRHQSFAKASKELESRSDVSRSSVLLASELT